MGERGWTGMTLEVGQTLALPKSSVYSGISGNLFGYFGGPGMLILFVVARAVCSLRLKALDLLGRRGLETIC